MTQELLAAIHREVDDDAGEIAAALGDRLQCRKGCAGCCVDGITVFAIEAERIRREQAELLRTAEPHPEGACAFLDEAGACRIYHSRPYVCRTQGLPLRWLDEDERGEMVELRDICTLNEPGEPPLVELDPRRCFTLGPYESRLRELAGADLRRVALRSLFGGDGS